jgi:hypothetical protein
MSGIAATRASKRNWYFGSTLTTGQQDPKYLQQFQLQPEPEGLAHNFEMLMTIANYNTRQLCSKILEFLRIR